MTDKKISALPLASPLTGNELVPIVQNGRTCQTPASSFGWAILAQGVITDPVAFIDLVLPTGYLCFNIEFDGVQIDTRDVLAFAVSADGGENFFCDPDHPDTYAVVTDVIATTAQRTVIRDTIGGSAWNSLALIPGVALNEDSGTITDFSIRLYPGDSSTTFRGAVRSNTYSNFRVAALGQAINLLNPAATITPVYGRIDLVRVQPYGNGDCNPPTGGDNFISGSYTLLGLPNITGN